MIVNRVYGERTRADWKWRQSVVHWVYYAVSFVSVSWLINSLLYFRSLAACVCVGEETESPKEKTASSHALCIRYTKKCIWSSRIDSTYCQAIQLLNSMRNASSVDKTNSRTHTQTQSQIANANNKLTNCDAWNFRCFLPTTQFLRWSHTQPNALTMSIQTHL